MVKINTSDVKRGTILDMDNGLFRVTETSHTHMGRGGATYGFKVKEITTGKTKVVTFNAGTTLEQADVQTMNAIFLYAAGDSYAFMINDTAEIIELDKDFIEDVVGYLKENLDLFLMMHEGNVLGVILPATVDYTITETVPGMKGNRAQAGKKPATLETGMEVQVPLHKNEGDVITINTQSGDIS